MDASPTIAITIDRAEGVNLASESGERCIFVVGRADLPDGTVLTIDVFFEGVQGPTEKVVLTGRAFQHRFPVTGRVLPGTYAIRVRYLAEDQRRSVARQIAEGTEIQETQRDFTYGEPGQADVERVRIRDRLLFILRNLRELHSQLGMNGSFTFAKAAYALIEGLANGENGVPDARRREILDDWRTFTGETWDPRFATIRYDFREFERYVFMSYYPGVLEEIRALMTTMVKWYASYTKAILEQAGAPVPEAVAAEGSIPREELYRDSLRMATQIYQDLGVDPEPWRLNDLGNPETIADAQGDLFRSTISKFEVHKPGDAWIFDVTPFRPATRLRIRPVSEQDQAIAVCGVEILDYPMAESFQELGHFLEVDTASRWPGYHLIQRRDLSVADETMDGGTRPGLEMTFTFSADGQTVYRAWQWSLFCRWHKRTYSVLSFTPQNIFDQWQPQFEQINRSFAVLDAPWIPHEGGGSEAPAPGSGG